MRILLTAINAKYIHSNLAIYNLRAATGELAGQVELAEFTINQRTEEILRDLYHRKPDVLLFSCYIWNIEYVKELVVECGKVLPETPVWLGGPEVSYDAPELLQRYPQLTGILTGEGEESFRLLTEYYVGGETKRGRSLAEIPGAVWRSLGEIGEIRVNGRVNGPKRKDFAGAYLDMNQIPFPYSDMEGLEHKILYYESSRGCPFSCSYCLSSIEKSVRFRDLSLVEQELQYFLDAGVLQVKFVDRTFNCRRSHALAIWRYIQEHDNGVTNFHFEIAADLLGEEELMLLEQMRPGLVQLEIGVQSTNSRTLKAIHRTTDLGRLQKNVQRIHRRGNIHQHLDLIAGLPYEDYESFAHSFDEVFAMEPEQLQLGFLKVLKGSPMYQEAESYGIVWREKPPYEVLYSKWLSFSEILQLKSIEEMVEIYYNSHQFRCTLARLLKEYVSPFHFFEELAVFYEESGQNGKNHSRLQRYEILLEFIRSRHPKEEQAYRELLTVDLYLRERLKSRPGFALDQSAFREEIRRILLRIGKQNHVEVLTAQGEEPIYLCFDYSRRNPLTGDAYAARWEGEAYDETNRGDSEASG